VDCHRLRRHRLDIIQPARSPPLILSVISCSLFYSPSQPRVSPQRTCRLGFSLKASNIQQPTSLLLLLLPLLLIFHQQLERYSSKWGSRCLRVVASSSTHKTNLFCRHGRLTETSLSREKLQTKCPVPQSLVVRYAVEAGTVAGKNTFTSRCSSGSRCQMVSYANNFLTIGTVRLGR